jgi:hypothetical protein
MWTVAATMAAALSTSPPSTAGTCPAETFEGFLAAFLDDVAVQRRFTLDPLPTTAAEPYDYELLLTDRLVPARDLRFPLVPGRAERERRGVAVEPAEVSTQTPRARLAGPDGYRVVLEFEAGDCWRLARLDDQSS